MDWINHWIPAFAGMTGKWIPPRADMTGLVSTP